LHVLNVYSAYAVEWNGSNDLKLRSITFHLQEFIMNVSQADQNDVKVRSFAAATQVDRVPPEDALAILMRWNLLRRTS